MSLPKDFEGQVALLEKWVKLGYFEKDKDERYWLTEFGAQVLRGIVNQLNKPQ